MSVKRLEDILNNLDQDIGELLLDRYTEGVEEGINQERANNSYYSKGFSEGYDLAMKNIKEKILTLLGEKND